VVHLADRRPRILRDAIRENCTKSVVAACSEQRAAGRFEVQPTSVCVTKELPDALRWELAGMEGIGVVDVLVVLGSVWRLLGRDSAPYAERRATTPVLCGAETDRTVSERAETGTPPMAAASGQRGSHRWDTPAPAPVRDPHGYPSSRPAPDHVQYVRTMGPRT